MNICIHMYIKNVCAHELYSSIYIICIDDRYDHISRREKWCSTRLRLRVDRQTDEDVVITSFLIVDTTFLSDQANPIAGIR